jgi:hypothetical protein
VNFHHATALADVGCAGLFQLSLPPVCGPLAGADRSMQVHGLIGRPPGGQQSCDLARVFVAQHFFRGDSLLLVQGDAGCADLLQHARSGRADFSASERPARTAGTIVKDEGEGGKQLAAFLAERKFV